MKRSNRYYERLLREFGVGIYCPICDCRPCWPGGEGKRPCRLGIFTEDELVKLSNRLKHLDDPRERK